MRYICYEGIETIAHWLNIETFLLIAAWHQYHIETFLHIAAWHQYYIETSLPIAAWHQYHIGTSLPIPALKTVQLVYYGKLQAIGFPCSAQRGSRKTSCFAMSALGRKVQAPRGKHSALSQNDGNKNGKHLVYVCRFNDVITFIAALVYRFWEVLQAAYCFLAVQRAL